MVKEKTEYKAVGVSKDGRNTKIHAMLGEQAIPYRRKLMFRIHGQWIDILTGSVT